MLTLIGRRKRHTMEVVTGVTILKLAMKHKVDWGFSCARGICARCRCYVTEGRDLLQQPNEAEIARLEPEEIEQGYRLGCQAHIVRDGHIEVKHKPYF